MISDVLAEAKEKMHKSVEAAKDDFSNVRTGRANPALFQKILVDYYGTLFVPPSYCNSREACSN